MFCNLQSVYLGFWKVKVRRVTGTVVEFGMYNRSGDGVGCLEVKIVGGECSAVDECDSSRT